MGEITGGGTAPNPDGEIKYCDIEICLANDDTDSVKWLADMLNSIGIPKGFVLQGVDPEIETPYRADFISVSKSVEMWYAGQMI